MLQYYACKCWSILKCKEDFLKIALAKNIVICCKFDAIVIISVANALIQCNAGQAWHYTVSQGVTREQLCDALTSPTGSSPNQRGSNYLSCQ